VIILISDMRRCKSLDGALSDKLSAAKTTKLESLWRSNWVKTWATQA